jgi:RND family efflux transporter MFP subunit
MTRTALVITVVAALGLGAGAGYWVAHRDAAEDPVPAPAASRSIYHCPMHPQVVSDRPGSCPICGMALVSSASVAEPTPGPAVAGRDTVVLSDRKRHLIGATTVDVVEAPLSRVVRATARIAYDDTRMYHVHTKIQGWIEHVFAGAAGDVVKRGDPLLEIYSPDLLASQQEYLVALDNRVRIANTTLPEVRENADHLVGASRKRLLLQDMSESQLDDLVRTRQAQRTVILYSPLAGTITARNISHGERVESEMSLLDIADLSQVWVVASIYEADVPFVRPGQKAEITLSYLPGRTYEGRVALVSPLVDDTTRTVQARIELDNSDLALKPGMFADVRLTGELGRGLTVPKDAVLRTGERDLVFVSPSDGVFEPREVTLGRTLADRYEIVQGVAAGERVLASAGFFVDSESRLKSALRTAGDRDR